MDFTNLKLLQAMSGINPYQGQDENSFNAAPMAKPGMFDNLFQPQQQINGMQQAGQMIPSGINPNAQDQLTELLKGQPLRENYKPGFMTKLGSGLVSITDPRLGQEMLNRGYDNAVDEWTRKLDPIKQQAVIERSENTNNRMLEAQRQRDENADLERKRKETSDQLKSDTQRENIAQKDRFLAYKYYKDAHPNKVFKSDSEGKVYAVDPQSGQVDYITDNNGEPIHDSKLPEMERLNIQQNNRLIAQENQGRITRTNQANQGGITRTNQANASELRKSEMAVRGDESRKTKQTVPGKAPGNEKRVKVVSPDGKVGTVPESQVAKAVKSGYKVQ